MTSSPSIVVRDDRSGRGRRPIEFADLGSVLRIDHIHVIALLVGQDGSARDCQDGDRLHALDEDGDEFAIVSSRTVGCAGCADTIRVGKTPRSVTVSVFSLTWRYVVGPAILLVDPAVGSAASARLH